MRLRIRALAAWDPKPRKPRPARLAEADPVRLVFVRPGLGRMAEGWNLDSGCMQPLTFAVLAALTPPGIEVSLIDDRVEKAAVDHEAYAAVFSVETYNAKRAYELMAAYRGAGVRVIAGGMHPSLAPDEAAAHADAVVTGDAESVWPSILRDLEAGRLGARYGGNANAPIQSGLLPRRDIFKGKKYLPVDLIQFGRGCRFACSYCASGAYYLGSYRRRPVSEVVREIREQGLKRLIFTDDDIVADRESSLELFRALKPLRLRWGGQASLGLADDPELMDAMAESGCLGNVFGFESLSGESLKSMNKARNDPLGDRYSKRIAALRRHGIFLWGAFSLGHDGDDEESLEETLRFTVQERFAIASYMMLVPYPGTALYARLASEGRLLYGGSWWLHPDYRYNRCPFVPARMTAERLEESLRSMARRFYSAGSIASRALDPLTHLRSPASLGYYLAYNLTYRMTSVE